ncbi:MAG TPA: YdcF family protein [Gaiellaceae bacterium]|nr:YdcF family protein [Gaiellaceae bacterium]
MALAAARPDAIVVLGCRVPATARGQLHRRAEVAARAYHELRPRLVVASGGRPWSGVAEASALRDYMLAEGVPDGAIVRELLSLTTVENAIYSSEILRAASLERPLIVTSDWHTARAVACFAACGMRPTARAAGTPFRGAFATAKRGAGEHIRRHIDLLGLPLWFET